MNLALLARLGLSAPVALVAMSAFAAGASAQVTIYGALSNFDVPNETDDDCDEFEIELHGPNPDDIYHTYRNGNYGSPTITAIPGGTLVRYHHPAHRTLPGSIEHFGISLRNFNADPTPTFTWLRDGLPAGFNPNPLQPQIVTQEGFSPEGDPVVIETVTNLDPYNRRMWIRRSVSNVAYVVNLEDLMTNDPLVQEAIDIDPTPVFLTPGASRVFNQLEMGDGIASAVINYEVYRDRVVFGTHMPGAYAGTVMNAVVLSTSNCEQAGLYVITQPADARLLVGGEAEFGVDINNDEGGALTFQWFHEGQEIPNSDSDTFTVRDVTPADSGTYYCHATNSCGIVISAVARLDVIPCPGDYNQDAQVDFFDYDDFVSDFVDESPRADFNNDHTLDFFDYDDFIIAFETPC